MMNNGRDNMNHLNIMDGLYNEVVSRLEDAEQCCDIAKELNLPLELVESIMFESYGVLPDDEE
jgi:hypothetical protein